MPVYAPVIGTGINNNYSFSTFSTNPPVSGSVYTIDGAGGTDTFVFAKGTTYLDKFSSTGFTIAPADASGTIVVSGASPKGTSLTFNLKSVEQLVFGNGTVQLVYNVNQLPTGAVTISGTPTQNQTLTAVSTLADANGIGTLSYQWSAAGVAITGATASTLTLAEAQVGKAITVKVSYTDLLGTAESVLSTATAVVVNVNDLPTGAVTISGTATQGQTLTAVTSALADPDGLGAFSYQWYAGGTAITGATGSTRVLTLAEVGKVITVKASYTDGHGTLENVTSSATAAVAHLNTAPTGLVTITGTETQGQTLTASNSLADVDGITPPITYQWYAGGTAITGATGSTRVLTQTEVGKVITVQASYTDGFSKVESVGSAATTAVANINDSPTGSVTISGTLSTGQTLTANSNTLADLDGLGVITYQWRANGTVISGATGSTYLLTLAEAGKTITATASYTDGYGAVESVTSAATAAVFTNTAPTGAVTIGGTVTQNQQLTAVTSALVDVDGLGSFSYQWKANGVAIAGATASTLTLAEAQVGKTITVQTSYTDGRGAFESVVSTATAVVVNVNDAPTGAVTISGTATQGQTLTAVTSALADPDGLGAFSYQWYAGGTAITGATASTLTLAEAQVGKAITVNVNYTDGHGTAESVLSTATAAVVNVNDAPTGAVTITGTATEDHTLTASTSTLADADGLGTITYKWYTGATLISGAAVASTYTLKEIDVNKDINVVATYTDGHSTVEHVSSAVVPYGVTISSETANGAAGTTVTTTTTVHEVTAKTAIHLVPGILDVTLPEDIGLVEQEFTGTAINGLAAQLGADPLISSDLLPGINAYVATAPQQVTVRSLSFDTSSQPILISGVGTVGQEALVIDANGSNLTLDNVEFALVIGAATITGGAGNNVVYADGANQHIVLGVGDDTLHGGAGNDYIGSLAGNDHLFGDAGNDTLSGGADNDTLDGGDGDDTAVFSGNYSDYAITQTGVSSYRIEDGVGGDGTDVVTNVENFQFLDFPNGKKDIIAPTVASFAPADAATGVAVGSNIVLNFSEAIQRGTVVDSSIVIHSGTPTGVNAVVETFTAATSANLAISGLTLTINPTADLTTGTHYYITLANGSIDDLAGNHYAGTSAYDFTTASAATAFAASDSGGGGGAGVALAGVGALGLLAFVLF